MEANYKLCAVSLEINGRLSTLKIKVSNDVLELKGGKKVQAICFVRANGDIGATQFWTPAYIEQQVAEAEVLVGYEADARKTFAK